MTKEKLRLSVGASPAQRAVAVVFGLVFAAVGAAFVTLPVVAAGLLRRLVGADDGLTTYENARDLPPGMLPPELQDSSAGGSGWDGAGPGPALLLGLFGVPFVLLGLIMALRALGAAAWLDGTRVRVRGALGTRAVDLSRAEITAEVAPLRHGDDDAYPTAHLGRAIIARDPDVGCKVTIPLQGTGLATLPPHELRALADAMTVGRPADGRDGDAHSIARQLRTMADNPLGL
ncbi:hypothetical protein JNW88_12425 [Micromonospora sp. ATA32]|nr:hypothetical protein [Micromonospora sp. ATA32]